MGLRERDSQGKKPQEAVRREENQARGCPGSRERKERPGGGGRWLCPCEERSREMWTKNDH